MSKSFESVRECLLGELVMYKSKARLDKRRHEEPLRDQQLEFWLGNAVFWIIQLQLRDEEGNLNSYSAALNKAWECLDRLHKLLG